MTSPALKCSVCLQSGDAPDQELTFASCDNLWAHIAMVHFQWMPFECVLCPMMCMPSEGVLKRHYLQAHPGRTPKAIYTYEEDKKTKVRKILLESPGFADEINLRLPTKQAPMATFNQRTSTPRTTSADSGHSLPTEQYQYHVYNDVTNNSDLSVASQLDVSPNNDHQTPSKRPFLTDLHKPTEIVANIGGTEEENEPESEMEQQDNKDCIGVNKSRKFRTTHFLPNTSGLLNRFRAENPQQICHLQCRLCHMQVSYTGKNKHVWSHVKTKPLRCNQCDHEARKVCNMKRHAARIHPNIPPEKCWTERRAELKPEYFDIYKQAFGESAMKAVKMEPDMKPQLKHELKVQCQICHREFSAGMSKSKHVWRYHVSQRRFVCNQCGVSANQLSDIRKHALSKHQITEEICWTDNTRDLATEYVSSYESAFGPMKSDGKFHCRLCDEEVVDKRQHIETRHMPSVYKCQTDECGFELSEWNEKAIAEHYAMTHLGAQNQVIQSQMTTASDVTGGLEALLKSAFGE